MVEIQHFWTQQEAIELCRRVEMICPQAGCHVALTGGLLYRFGQRKDCDLLFYRIRQIPKIDMVALWKNLAIAGITNVKGFGWCYKGEYEGKSVDMFFPEEKVGKYYGTK